MGNAQNIVLQKRRFAYPAPYYAHSKLWQTLNFQVPTLFKIISVTLYLVHENDLDIQQQELTNYFFFFDLEVLLPAWETSPNTQGLTNFVHFFYNYGNRILNKGLLLRKERQQAAFLTFIQQKKLMQHLEAESNLWNTSQRS